MVSSGMHRKQQRVRAQMAWRAALQHVALIRILDSSSSVCVVISIVPIHPTFSVGT